MWQVEVPCWFCSEPPPFHATCMPQILRDCPVVCQETLTGLASPCIQHQSAQSACKGHGWVVVSAHVRRPPGTGRHHLTTLPTLHFGHDDAGTKDHTRPPLTTHNISSAMGKAVLFYASLGVAATAIIHGYGERLSSPSTLPLSPTRHRALP